MKTRDLTNGERLLVERRRFEEPQRDAADRCMVSLYCYRRWEVDLDQPPRVPLGRLKQHEECFLLRRRAGVSVKELARAMDISRWWVIQMEYGREPADRLVEHWGAGVPT